MAELYTNKRLKVVRDAVADRDVAYRISDWSDFDDPEIVTLKDSTPCRFRTRGGRAELANWKDVFICIPARILLVNDEWTVVPMHFRSSRNPLVGIYVDSWLQLFDSPLAFVLDLVAQISIDSLKLDLMIHKDGYNLFWHHRLNTFRVDELKKPPAERRTAWGSRYGMNTEEWVKTHVSVPCVPYHHMGSTLNRKVAWVYVLCMSVGFNLWQADSH